MSRSEETISPKTLSGLKVDVPEPKLTYNLDSKGISKALKVYYKPTSRTGKEANTTSKYTNAILKQILGIDADVLEIKFSYVRKDWIIGILNFAGVPFKEQVGAILFDTGRLKESNKFKPLIAE